MHTSSIQVGAAAMRRLLKILRRLRPSSPCMDRPPFTPMLDSGAMGRAGIHTTLTMHMGGRLETWSPLQQGRMTSSLRLRSANVVLCVRVTRQQLAFWLFDLVAPQWLSCGRRHGGFCIFPHVRFAHPLVSGTVYVLCMLRVYGAYSFPRLCVHRYISSWLVLRSLSCLCFSFFWAAPCCASPCLCECVWSVCGPCGSVCLSVSLCAIPIAQLFPPCLGTIDA
mmetsp:Transcript_16680/g.40033  ORF Transcript_16680/g.40033 Transcript_16680/m.40033 type:complete len:223 (-) Transcript_16680:1120-1788(-)